MRRGMMVLMLGAAFVALAPASGFARVGVVVGIAPPVAVIEPPPPPPVAPGYVWQPGYWSWNGVQYVWVPGAYALAPYAGAVWVPGVWVAGPGGYVWRAGHWRR